MDPSAVVRVTFSEAIDPASVTQNAVTVTGPEGAVAGRVDLILNNTVLVFTPNKPLSTNAQYGVTLGTVRDRAGNSLAPPASRSFATIDTIPPTLSSLSLPSGARTIEARNITLTAVSPDVDVARVEFYADTAILGTATARPYVLTVLLPAPTAPDRSMVLSAVATDRVGNRGPAVSLTIVAEPPLPTLTSLLPPVLPLEMGGSGSLTLAINRVQPTDTAVALTSDHPTVASVPPSVTVPAGAQSVVIPVTPRIPGTASIMAALNDTSVHSTVTVTPVGPIIASLRPGTLQITQGASGTLTLALTAAPAADAEVTLTTSNAGIVGLPPSSLVIIPAGQLQQTFAVFGVSPGQATITATFNYTSAQSQVSVVTPAATVVSLLPPVLPLTVGSRGALTVTLNASQAADTTVALVTSDPAVVSLPADHLVVPAHQHAAAVYVTGLAPGLATVAVWLAGSSAVVGIEVLPAPARVARLDCPSPVTQTATALCRVTLNATQPGDTAVPLAASAADVLQVPAGVTVPAGSLDAEAGVTGLAAGTATVVAGPVNDTSRSAEVQVVAPPPAIASLGAESATVMVGATVTLTLSLDAAAPGDTVVIFAANPVGILAAPATVTVPAGHTAVEITVTAVAMGAVTLTAGPLNGGSAQRGLIVNQLPPGLDRIVPSTLSLPKGTAGSLEVAIAPTQPQATVVALSSSDPSVEVPAQVTVEAGAVTAEFPVLGRIQGAATVTAGPLNAASWQASVTVTAPEPVSLSISPPAASIGRGELQQFTVTATYTDINTRDVTAEVAWTSSDPIVATITSPGGRAQGLAEGQVTLVATLGGVSGRVSLAVTLWPSTGPVIAGLAPEIGTVGTAVQIVGSGFSPRAADNRVTFNGIQAVVTAASETSLTAGVPAGATTGPVSVTLGGHTATSPGIFTVLQTLAIAPNSVTVALGGSVGFRATLDGVPTAAVTWRVSGIPGGNTSVGTISASGFYTAPAALPAVLPVQVDAVLTSDPSRVVTATVQIVSQTSGVLVTAPVSVAVTQPGSALATSAPVSVAVTQPTGAQVLTGPVSVAVTQPGSAQVTSAPVSVAVSPVITGISPATGRVGTIVSLAISGANLQGTTAVQVLKDGLPDTTVTASAITTASDGTGVTCTLTIGASATTGARVLQAVTAHGRSSNFTLSTNIFTVNP